MAGGSVLSAEKSKLRRLRELGWITEADGELRILEDGYDARADAIPIERPARLIKRGRLFQIQFCEGARF